MTISGRTYRVSTAAGPGATVWTNLDPGVMATGHYTRVSLSASSNRIVRIITP